MRKEVVWAAVAVPAAVAGLAGVAAGVAAFAWALAGSASARPAVIRCRTAKEYPALRKSVRSAGQ